MVITFCRSPLCKMEIFVLDSMHIEEGLVIVELARARLDMKACCVVSVQVALNAIRLIQPAGVEIRVIEPQREPNPN